MKKLMQHPETKQIVEATNKETVIALKSHGWKIVQTDATVKKVEVAK